MGGPLVHVGGSGFWIGAGCRPWAWGISDVRATMRGMTASETAAVLPQVAEGLEVADFETELVVLVPQRRMVHLLEPDAALVFDSCRRGDSTEVLVAELAEASGREPADVAAWVDGALAELASKQLLAADQAAEQEIAMGRVADQRAAVDEVVPTAELVADQAVVA